MHTSKEDSQEKGELKLCKQRQRFLVSKMPGATRRKAEARWTWHINKLEQRRDRLEKNLSSIAALEAQIAENHSPSSIKLPPEVFDLPESSVEPSAKQKKHSKRNAKKAKKGRNDIDTEDGFEGSPRDSPKGGGVCKISARQCRQMGDKEEFEDNLEQVCRLLAELKALDKDAAILKYTNWT